MAETQQKPKLKHLADMWDDFPAFITRSEAKKITGGVISKRTLELDDQYGRGPRKRFFLNGKIAYPKAEFLEYLETKDCQVIEVKAGP